MWRWLVYFDNGVDNPSKNKKVIQKIKDNTDYIELGKKVSAALKKKTPKQWKDAHEKRVKTMLIKYGVSNVACFDDVRKKMRLSKIEQIKNNKFNGYQWYPCYNPNACDIIDEYGKRNGYNFQHAMNGGEFYITELGYWVDAYDKNKNIVLEVDEKKHFDANGNLKIKDIKRQIEIEDFLKCKFIRLKI